MCDRICRAEVDAARPALFLFASGEVAYLMEKLMKVSKAIELVMDEPPNPSTVWRWIRHGIQLNSGEHLKLKVWYVGNTPHTRISELMEFIDRRTEDGPRKDWRSQSSDEFTESVMTDIDE